MTQIKKLKKLFESQEKSDMFQVECFDLFRKGLLPKEVIKNTGRSVSFVYKVFNQYKQAV